MESNGLIEWSTNQMADRMEASRSNGNESEISCLELFNLKKLADFKIERETIKGPIKV